MACVILLRVPVVGIAVVRGALPEDELSKLVSLIAIFCELVEKHFSGLNSEVSHVEVAGDRNLV